MSKKNTTLERRSAQVPAKSSKRSSADESAKKPVPEIERMVSDAGLKRKQGGMDVKYSKKLISSVEAKISKVEEYEAVKDQPYIQQFMHLETLAWAGPVFHNIVMRLTNLSAMGDALWFELGEDLGRFSINEFCLITGLNCVGSTHLPVVENRLISRYFFMVKGVSRENLELQMSNAKFDNNDDAVKLSLLYIIFCIPLSNASSVKIDPKFFALADNLDAFNDFPWGVLSLEATRAYKTLPSIASKFTTKYDQAIPHMMSWTTTDNVKFDDVLVAFTTLKCFVLMPTEEELKNPWVARLFLKNPNAQPQLLPPKSSVPRSSTDTNSEWREFQKEIRGQVASLNKKLEDLKKEQKHSNKLLWRVLKMLSTNMIEKGQGKAQTTSHVNSSQEINVQRAESDVFKTTSPEIGAIADIGVQAAMEFLTADKVISSHEDAENEKNKIPKKKRARLSRLGQRPSGRMTEVGSPSKALSKLIYALPPGLADEPPK
ncbi:hypothetical protein TIFTF001_023169 [Ficus carica]|uniref:DUF1985 domain-containing protein n=1 Tax=Ficus carica TaxID=3494 RepID=A0AA88DC99_FICCA|nr:hypothetical protein TIFTF001_023169 [Ficus carica]